MTCTYFPSEKLTTIVVVFSYFLSVGACLVDCLYFQSRNAEMCNMFFKTESFFYQIAILIGYHRSKNRRLQESSRSYQLVSIFNMIWWPLRCDILRAGNTGVFNWDYQMPAPIPIGHHLVAVEKETTKRRALRSALTNDMASRVGNANDPLRHDYWDVGLYTRASFNFMLSLSETRWFALRNILHFFWS